MNEIMLEHLKSGVSINSHIGCSLGCTYCILSSIPEYPKSPIKIIEPQVLIEKLLADRMYVRNITPIYINNRTDPFLPQVINDTYEMLELLTINKIESPILLITKLAPDERIIKYFDKLNILFVYTYAGLPEGFDYNSNRKININNIKKIKEIVPKKNRFHYYRPIIPSVNDNIESFEIAMKQVGCFCTTTIIGGLRPLKKENEIMKKIQIGAIDSEHKIFNEDFYTKIRDCIKKYNLNVVRHTSCAVSVFLGKKNNLQYYGREGHCYIKCNNYEVCSSSKNDIDMERVKQFLRENNIKDYEIEHNVIKIKELVKQELVSAIKCGYGCVVEAEHIELCVSEKAILSDRKGIENE